MLGGDVCWGIHKGHTQGAYIHKVPTRTSTRSTNPAAVSTAHTRALSTSWSKYFNKSSVCATPALARYAVASASNLNSAAAPFLALARAFSRASSIATSYPAMSTFNPASSAISCVRSTGKPNVSHNKNASLPSSLLLVEALAIFLNCSIPLFIVRRKDTSSSLMMLWIWGGGKRVCLWHFVLLLMTSPSPPPTLARAVTSSG